MRGAQKSASGSSCVLQRHGGDGLDGHRASRTHDPEFCVTSCARTKLGLHPGPATPHRNRAYGHETSPLAAAWSFVARGVPRSTAASARRSEDDSAIAVVGSDRMLTLNVDRGNLTIIPSPRTDPAERPTDPGRRGKEGSKAELKKNQMRRCYAEKTSIFFQTTGRHPPGARRETTEVKKTRRSRPAALRTSAHGPC